MRARRTIRRANTLQGTIVTFVYLEVISPDSTTNWFNRAHDRVRRDERCLELLGGGRIRAYGEPTSNRWSRNRYVFHLTAHNLG